MASVNKVILLGNCGRDPEVRTTASGQSMATVSIATSSRRRDRNSGEMVEETQWHRVMFFERLAEIAGEYLRRGNPVYIEGRLRYGKYTDKDGVERNTTDIVAEQMQLLGGRGEGRGAPASDMGASPSRATPARAAAPAPAPAAPATARGNTGTGFDDMDDDIPF